MQQLYPSPDPAVDPAAVYRHDPPPADRALPRVLVNMVASVDGATVAEGVTEGLSSPGDKRIFFLLRTLADVILVGAQTVRAEGYGTARLSEAAMAARRDRGQAPAPRIAVVTRSLHLDWSTRLFTEATVRPFVIAPPTADPARLAAAREVADAVVVGDTRVDLVAALRALRERDVGVVLCEGGPTLNAELAGADLIDELCLTIAPALVGAGGGDRIIAAAPLPGLHAVSLLSVLEDDGSLFLRYAVGAEPG